MSRELARLRFQQKVYADKVSSPFKALEVNEKVRMQTSHRDWQSATVVEKTAFPRSVIVETSSGKRYRRNTGHLQRSKAKIPGPMDLESIVEVAEAISNDAHQSTLNNSHQSTSNNTQQSTEAPDSTKKSTVLPTKTVQNDATEQPYVTRSGRQVNR